MLPVRSVAAVTVPGQLLQLGALHSGARLMAGPTKAAVGGGVSKAKAEVTPTIRAETALTPQAAVGESARPDAYVHAPQGLFPAPLPPAERASGAPARLAWV